MAYATVGFTALVYEVAWTRTLSMVLGSSIYAFAAMLAAFLLGIALGSIAARAFVDRLREPRLVFAWGIALLGVLSVATMWMLPRLPDLFLWAVGVVGLEKGSLIAVELGLSIAAMLPPTLVLGALFPVLARALASDADQAPEAVGRVYFANTVGSATGAFVAGFVLIPWLGLQGTMILATSVNLITAGVLLALRAELRPPLRAAFAAVAALTIAALVLAPPDWNREALASGAFYQTGHSSEDQAVLDLVPKQFADTEIVYYREGINTTVSVHRFQGAYALYVNGKPDASSIADMPTQVMSGQIPMLFGKPAKDVLVIGWASGVTVGSVLRHPAEKVTVVELEPAVVEASRFFDPQSGDPLQDPRVEVVLDDGRIYLSYTPERYDVIVSEPSNPWITGASSLFTLEHLQAARAALRPGGRYLQWIQLYGMDPDGLQTLLRTIRSVFPFVYGFTNALYESDLILLCALEPLERAQLPTWETTSGAVREDLTRVGTFSTEDLWSAVRLLPDDVRAIAGDVGPLNTDDNMYVELRAPWLLYAQTLDDNWNLLGAFDRGISPLLEPDETDALGRLALSYALVRGDHRVATQLIEQLAGTDSAHAQIAWVELGRRLQQISVEEQLEAADRAIAGAPLLPLPRLTRAQVRLHAGQPALALEDVDVAMRTRADDPRVHALRGTILLHLGRPEEAAVELEQVLGSPFGLSAAATPLYAVAAAAYGALGRPREQIPHLEMFLERSPFAPDRWRALAAAYRAVGRTQDAETALRNGRDIENAARKLREASES